ncbi:MAG: hypothetical protein NC124_03940 [Clostridium sp.]|nr:hypothetical protein [Clostridium sp.]
MDNGVENSVNPTQDNETGVVYGNISVGENTYEMNKFHAKQGHGFAAERAEHIHDLYHGEDAQILGDDNAKDGADRLVNGAEIQSKYCRSGSECIQKCFENGKYRYYSRNGEPMQVEVPLDMYDDAVKAMKRRIANNQVEGVTNPEDAEKIVKKGHYTYAQAKQIAQAGTIESLTFDAANGIIIAKDAMGITALITFATSIWNGDDFEGALENAALSGLKVGGVSFLTTIISSQLARTSVTTSIRAGTDLLVSKMGAKATSYLANALRSGTSIYGVAAMNNVSKLLAGNIIASTVSLVVLSTGDIIDVFRGRISGEQLVKDVAVTGATIAGGNAGWVAGNAAGAVIGGAVAGAVTGGAGTAAGAKMGSKVGGFVGSAAGGTAAGQVAHSALDNVIEDDSVKMMKIVEQEFVTICEQYLLTENEVYACLPLLKDRLTKKELKNIYASCNRELYVQSIILDCVHPILSKRMIIDNVQDEDIFLGMQMLIEDAVDGEGIFDERACTVSTAQIQNGLLVNSNIREDQVMQIMQPVMQINKTHMKAERTLRSMKRSDEDMQGQMVSIMQERENLKSELDKLLEE